MAIGREGPLCHPMHMVMGRQNILEMLCNFQLLFVCWSFLPFFLLYLIGGCQGSGGPSDIDPIFDQVVICTFLCLCCSSITKIEFPWIEFVYWHLYASLSEEKFTGWEGSLWWFMFPALQYLCYMLSWNILMCSITMLGKHIKFGVPWIDFCTWH